MDNITHSLTGALAAKLASQRGEAGMENKSAERTVFWLTVVSANLPDIDIVLNLLGDPMFAIQNHRGLTHSILFAPFIALLPAAVAYKLGSVKRFKLLWGMSLLGILIHILFDLITPFGTQILAPVFSYRFSLDWMFIINPLFTGTLALLLFLGRKMQRHQRTFALSAAVFVISYLTLEMGMHTIGIQRVQTEFERKGIPFTRMSVLPQPLSPFRWMGLVQTDDAVYQTFFSILGNSHELIWKREEEASNFYVHRALLTPQASWFMKFARHPLIITREQGDRIIVEIRDQQFFFNPELMAALGFAERQPPFILRFTYSPDAELLKSTFNR